MSWRLLSGLIQVPNPVPGSPMRSRPPRPGPSSGLPGWAGHPAARQAVGPSRTAISRYGRDFRSPSQFQGTGPTWIPWIPWTTLGYVEKVRPQFLSLRQIASARLPVSGPSTDRAVPEILKSRHSGSETAFFSRASYFVILVWFGEVKRRSVNAQPGSPPFRIPFERARATRLETEWVISFRKSVLRIVWSA